MRNKKVIITLGIVASFFYVLELYAAGVTKGFMLTWGAPFYPETTGGVTTHIKDNVWGITLSSEIAAQLMGGEQ